MTTTATYRVRCDDCGAILYTDQFGDEYPTEEAAEAARIEAGWDDGYGRTACPNDRRGGAVMTNTTQPEPHVQATEYTVTLLPDDDINAHLYGITVQYRGGGRWAVVHMGYCLGADGDWEYGVKEYDRGDAWLDAHRFDEATALRLAKQAAPSVTVNGITAAEALRRREAAAGGGAR